MKSILTKKMIDSFDNRMKSQFKKEGMFDPPVLFMNTKKGVVASSVGELFANYDKRFVLTEMGNYYKPEEAIFMSETWFVKDKSMTNLRPSEHPSREEALMLIAKDRSGKKAEGRFYIIHPETRKLKRYEEDPSSIVGILDYLFDAEMAKLKEYDQNAKSKKIQSN